MTFDLFPPVIRRPAGQPDDAGRNPRPRRRADTALASSESHTD
jgi:hypothetical protein